MTPRKFLAAFLIGSLFATGAMAQGRQTENRSAYDPAVDAQRVVIRSSTGSAAPAGTTGDPLAVQGNVAAGQADAGNPVKIGCYAMATAPTAVSNGQREDVWCGTRGQISVQLSDASGNLHTMAPNNSTTIAPSATQQYLRALSFNYCWDGSQWVQSSVCTSSASFSGNAYTGAAGANGFVFKASAGNLYSLNVTAPGTAISVHVTNSTSIPADGTSSAGFWCSALAANASLDKVFPIPWYGTSGVTVFTTSTACGATSITKVAAANISGQVK